MARGYTLKKPDPSIFKGWGFVLVLGTTLAVLAMFHRGTLDATQVTQPTTGGSCQFEVTIDNLNVRSEPTLDGNAPVQTVSKGQVVAIKEKSRSNEQIKASVETARARGVPAWLDLSPETFSGTVRELPKREDIKLPIQEQLIVELYSK